MLATVIVSVLTTISVLIVLFLFGVVAIASCYKGQRR